MKKVCIIGGGLSGLTTAYLLKDKFEVTVLESSHRFGGYIQTLQRQNMLIDLGPNTILNNEPKTLELFDKLGLNEQIVFAKENSKKRFLFTKSKIFEVPSNPKDIFKSNILGWKEKLKIFLEPIFPPTFNDSKSLLSVSDFLRTHFGDFIADHIARTALVGIYGGDSQKLNIAMTLPKLIEMIKKEKSIIKGLQKTLKSRGPSKTINLKNGMESLIHALANQLKNKKVGCEVQSISQAGEKKYSISYIESDEEKNLETDYVVITTHGNKTFDWIKSIHTDSRNLKFDKIRLAPLRVICLGFEKELEFEGFGLLVDPSQNKNILGFLHPKDIFDGRVSKNRDYLIVMMGGVFKPELAKTSLERSVELAMNDLRGFLGNIPNPNFIHVQNHIPGIVQYENESLEELNYIKNLNNKNIGVFFNSILFDGISVNDCIRKSFEISQKIIQLEQNRSSS